MLGRMAITTATSFGAVGIASSLVTASIIGGPVGFVLGVGAAIAISLLDHFLGEKVMSAIFGNDLTQQHEELELIIFGRAYGLFGLTEHCTDQVKDSS